MRKLKRVVKPAFCFIFSLTAVIVSMFTTAAAVKEPGDAEKASVNNELIFSAVSGTQSRPDTVSLAVKGKSAISIFEIGGDGADAFTIISSAESQSGGKEVVVAFKPGKGLAGIVRARLKAMDDRGKVLREIALTGLSSKGLEGENEPPLSDVLSALGYRINLGWTSLANHCKPQRQGDEIAAAMFKKAGRGSVRITPVARYSPDFELPFGYYVNLAKGPEKHLVGTLAAAGEFPEHQTLFPRVEANVPVQGSAIEGNAAKANVPVEGSIAFDPRNASFGLYVSGPDHSAYSEDLWNMVYHSKNAAHAARIYQAVDADRKVIKNTYFVCFEEASNGDYNDYVFLIENVTLVQAAFVSLLNDGLDGWDIYLEETGRKDPDKNFRMEDGVLHVNGRQVGYVITQKTYGNYHLKVDFKWGLKRWPPRVDAKRDAGVCYHIAPDEPDKIWQQCIEYQVQEGDAGDFWLIGNTTIEVNGKRNAPAAYARIPKMKDAEHPSGSWNTLEIISWNGKSVHVLNGEVVNYGKNASIESGRILLQSEYAEVFYRNVRIREL